jgi:hypothetical protein
VFSPIGRERKLPINGFFLNFISDIFGFGDSVGFRLLRRLLLSSSRVLFMAGCGVVISRPL